MPAYDHVVWSLGTKSLPLHAAVSNRSDQRLSRFARKPDPELSPSGIANINEDAVRICSVKLSKGTL